jgi:hypothetical protein
VGKRGGSKPIEANRPKTRPEVEALQKSEKNQAFPMRSISFVIFICSAGEHIAILTCLIARLFGLQTCLILAGSNVRSATQQQQHCPTDGLNKDSEEEVSLEAFSLAMREKMMGDLYTSMFLGAAKIC